MTDSEKKLEIPLYCIIPYEVRINKNIPDSCKIYFGEISVLAKKEGYCWAEDEDLAEMKGVSVRTIQDWHKILEDEGFIWRDTKNFPHRDSEGKLRWKKRRKIWVHNVTKNKEASQKEDSNKVSEAQKSAEPNGHAEICGSNGHAEKCGYKQDNLGKVTIPKQDLLSILQEKECFNSPMETEDWLNRLGFSKESVKNLMKYSRERLNNARRYLLEKMQQRKIIGNHLGYFVDTLTNSWDFQCKT